MAELQLTNKEISIFTTDGLNGGKSRRLFITVDDITEVPEELFAVKVSQSNKPEKAGKTVFKYLSFKQDGDGQPWQDFAPKDVTIATPVAEIKAKLVSFVQSNNLQLKYQLAVNLNGKFANISTAEGRFTLFDDVQFAASEGNPGYYLKRGTRATVTLKEAMSNYGKPYFQVTLATSATPDEIFQKSGRAKVWGQEDDAVADDFNPSTDLGAGTSSDNIWG